jgi:hypothetical protein
MNSLLNALVFDVRAIHSLLAIPYELFGFTVGVITNRICWIVLNYFQLKYTVHLSSISTKSSKIELLWFVGIVFWFVLSMKYKGFVPC